MVLPLPKPDGSKLTASELEEALVQALLRASGNVFHEVARPLTEVDLTAAQYEILRILGDGPADGIETNHVARQMVARAPNVTRLVDRLESRGLVHRIRCSKDRRVVWLQLTPEGRGIMDRLTDPMRRAVRAATVSLDEQERMQLCSLLERLQNSGARETPAEHGSHSEKE